MNQLTIGCVAKGSDFKPEIIEKTETHLELSISCKNGFIAFRERLSYEEWSRIVYFAKQLDALNEKTKKECP